MRQKKRNVYLAFWISFAIFMSGIVGSAFSLLTIRYDSDETFEKQLVVERHAYSILLSLAEEYVTTGRIREEIKEAYESTNSNLYFRFTDYGRPIYTNTNGSQTYTDSIDYEPSQYDGKYKLSIDYALKSTNIDDPIKQQFEVIDLVAQYRNPIFILTFLSGILFILSSFFIVRYVGVRQDGSIIVTFIDRIPIEILVVIVGLLIKATLIDHDSALLLIVPLLITARSVIVRMKARALYQYSLMRIINDIFTFSRNNNIGLIFVGFIGLAGSILIGIVGDIQGFVFIFMFWTAYTIIAYSWMQYTKEVATLSYLSADVRNGKYNQINTPLKSKVLYQIGKNLSEIQTGLQTAVDQQLKSEKTKSELITNVSHDLKTPLTSIVNYVDLLKHEDLSGTQQDYVNVLDHQVNRLKRLTEDLFEATKISAQDVEVVSEPVNLKVIWEQGVAEYVDDIAEKQLQFIADLEAVDLEVLADGKYFWRVIDNVLRNLISYSLENSRVYIDGSVCDDMACLSIKNISKDALNISEETLMERFVRGDASRNTDGSGLGLSIARSIVAMLKGTFDIKIDGDLFKVIICLPLVNLEDSTDI